MLVKVFTLAAVFALALPAAEDVKEQREKALLDRIEQLERRVTELEAREGVAQPQPAPVVATAAPDTPAPPVLPGGTTVNFQVDGYYSYNFNAPIGRANLLRAYDVLSNAFSLNQASVILESAPDPEHGKRFGARLDLQFGQATETLQGNATNELRPEIYRAIFQAYGTYVIPIGHGVTVDFGKWSSSLGIEGNYSKDQINYSRSLWFDYLPFYHMGVRATYKLSNVLGLNYWIINGTDQSEPFNGYKDQLFGFTLQPRKSVIWTVNYYRGQEHPDAAYYPNGGAPPNLPTLQGIPFQPIVDPPKGRLNIIDTYATLQMTPKLQLAFEGDYVDQRLYTNSGPGYTYGGAGYVRYQLLPKLALAGRSEYMADHAGYFSGAGQVLREATLTTEFNLGEGFLTRLEWRRDFSNRPYFLTDTLGVLQKQQSTATVGLVWWFGPKQGVW